MLKPYFYIIKHRPSGKLYAGCKYSSPDASNLMTADGYQTSSKIIWTMIMEDGLESFEILRIRYFQTVEETIDYERRFLIKVNAKNNSHFLNQSNSDGGLEWRNKGGYSLSEKTKRKMRKPKSEKARDSMRLSAKERNAEYYKIRVESRIRRLNGKNWHNDKTKEKITDANNNRWNELKNREEQSAIMKAFYKKNPVSEETRKKQSEKSKGEKNPMYGKTHSEEVRKKMKEAWIRRKAELNTHI